MSEMLETIRARAYNETAKLMSAEGCRLWRDELTGEDIAWLRNRLGLTVTLQSDGFVLCTPEDESKEEVQ